MTTQLIEIAREVAALLPGQWTAHVNDFPERHNGFTVRIERADGVHILMNIPGVDAENIHYTLECGMRLGQFHRITGVSPWGTTNVSRTPQDIASTLRRKFVNRLDDLLAEARPVVEAENAALDERANVRDRAVLSVHPHREALRAQVYPIEVAQPTFGKAIAKVDPRGEVTVGISGLDAEQFVRVAEALAAIGVPTHIPES